jgi:hypothetical protein
VNRRAARAWARKQTKDPQRRKDLARQVRTIPTATSIEEGPPPDGVSRRASGLVVVKQAEETATAAASENVARIFELPSGLVVPLDDA